MEPDGEYYGEDPSDLIAHCHKKTSDETDSASHDDVPVPSAPPLDDSPSSAPLDPPEETEAAPWIDHPRSLEPAECAEEDRSGRSTADAYAAPCAAAFLGVGSELPLAAVVPIVTNASGGVPTDKKSATACAHKHAAAADLPDDVPARVTNGQSPVQEASSETNSKPEMKKKPAPARRQPVPKFFQEGHKDTEWDKWLKTHKEKGGKQKKRPTAMRT